ncbi:MAG TPA: hypothetical protein VL547_16915 [Dinghuibacter sp.]|uniref:hypothetical protein n=1 Tax=Dinghuibacter sp. TaxID=2024697 RepID=UPI002C6ACB1F|nr:hypothetical protein [Dinghuibacter sp.]HTJ13722.1 hypothetical protein [Dinghuibacter sp.]
MCLVATRSHAQVLRDTVIIRDTIRPSQAIPMAPLPAPDTALRIRNFNPYFTIHVDSTLSYKFEINKDSARYYWYLRNSPVGLRIKADNGLLTFRADRSYFLSGRLKYDYPYKVSLGVQNLDNPTDRLDTSITVQFFNTEIIPSRVKPSVAGGMVFAALGDTVSFSIQCDEGSFPIENITFFTNTPISRFTPVHKCGDTFTWGIPYDFIHADDAEKQKTVILYFVGTDKFFNKDTGTVKITVKYATNYPEQTAEYKKLEHDIRFYILQLKYTFMVLDRQIKHNKGTRTTFDLTSAATALTGTVFGAMPNNTGQPTGTILPSVGIALVPVKEATAPTKTYEQNAATAIRSNIKRLEYSLSENSPIGDRDPDISGKIRKIREDLKQVQLQLIDVPLEIAENMNEQQLNDYFNNPKVNKKYRTRR